MKTKLILTALIVAFLVAPGCVRKKQVTQVQMDKSIATRSGTIVLSGTSTFVPKITADSTGGETTNIRGMSSSDFEDFLGNRDSVSATSAIKFDDRALELETKPLSRHRDLKSMEKTLDKRMDSLNKFLRSKSKQLYARKW